MGSMPRLTTATTFHSNSEDIKVTYKTGASFVGSVQDYKKTGSGTFVWPNGSKYEGEYVNNLRHGKGVQTWADGSRYEGGFVNDLRHAEGNIQWANGETYKGAFFKDRRHGKGTYSWPDNSSFTGTFYMDKKEGYGVFTLANGDIFEGLYKDDEREGPGVVKYKDSQQDVGIWRGEQLIKLLTATDKAFTMKEHEEFVYEQDNMMIPVVQPIDHMQPVKRILEPPALFNYAPEVKVSERITELYSEDLDPRSLAVNRQAFDEEFFKESSSPKEEEPAQIKVFNKTPTLVDIQMHIHKHRHAAPKAAFKVDKLLCFERQGFQPPGALETLSEELIRQATAGNTQRVEELLNSGKVHPDVADKNGHNALIGATVNWHQDTINVLLNHGANVNQLSDEGVSALAAGTVFYYPIEKFVFNIAERYLVQPTDVAQESNSGVPVKSAGSTGDHRASQINQLNRRKSEMAAVHISDAGDSAPLKDEDILSKEKSQVEILLQQESRRTMLESLESQGDQKKDSLKDSNKDSVLDGAEVIDGELEVEREEFESNVSVHNYHIEVTDTLVERCATQLSLNERVVSREASNVGVGKARQLAFQISHRERMKETLELLLKRGADPNAASVPMPVLFFAIKAADVDMVRRFLVKSASTSTTLGKDKGGLAPLHIAAAIPVEEGVAITELLLNALANPDVRAQEDDSFLNRTLMDEWSKDAISDESAALLGGRTPLQLCCARDDSYKHATNVVTLLLQHKANPNLLCNGFSPLALAIASGNDSAVDELLKNGANPSLSLTHGVGSALCVASSTEYEHRRPIQGRINLINKLIASNADILAPIPLGPKRQVGTAVDYAYYMFNLDRRIAHMPYHALTHAERETYNARKKLLAHVGDILRDKAVTREKTRHEEEKRRGLRSASPSAAFVYTGTGAPPPLKSKSAVTFETGAKDGKERVSEGEVSTGAVRSGVVTIVARDSRELKRLAGMNRPPIRKPLFKYCYECGRSVGVRLAACTRCKEVYYCSKACKLKAWNLRHKEECLRVPGKSRSPSPPPQKAASPTPEKERKSLRIHVPIKGHSKSAKGKRELSPQAIKMAGLLEALRAKAAEGKGFFTEDGRFVYFDNYSYN